jgi:hypothetical protein
MVVCGECHLFARRSAVLDMHEEVLTTELNAHCVKDFQSVREANREHAGAEEFESRSVEAMSHGRGAHGTDHTICCRSKSDYAGVDRGDGLWVG